jgi:outer membrane protein W
MNHLFFFFNSKPKTRLIGRLAGFFLFCSFASYGQDLIVTTTSDSLNCKIIEVQTEVIHFRFGDGNPISVKREEVKSYQYNYFTVTPVKTTKSPAQPASEKTTTVKNPTAVKPARVGYPPVYLSLALGARSFGSFSGYAGVNEVTSGATVVLGIDAAYFFGSSIGVGFKLNYAAANVIVDEINNSSYYDAITFWGPTLYGRWGKGKFGFTANAGLGGLSWSMSEIEINRYYYDDFSTISFGVFLSAGVNYMFTKHFGINANLQSVIGSVQGTLELTDTYSSPTLTLKRNPVGIGGTIGLDFRF